MMRVARVWGIGESVFVVLLVSSIGFVRVRWVWGVCYN
jgi:hypothetical protein